MLALPAVLVLGLLTACDPSAIMQSPVAPCTESGTQCQLPTGPLGVCERSPCPPGESTPCFQCISQH